MLYFNSVLLIVIWYLYIDLRIKYHSLKQQNRNNNKSVELLEKAFDVHINYLYKQLNKLKKGK